MHITQTDSHQCDDVVEDKTVSVHSGKGARFVGVHQFNLQLFAQLLSANVVPMEQGVQITQYCRKIRDKFSQ